MDIFSEFATDPKTEVEGAWFPLDKTTKVLVARANNEDYLTMLRKRLESAGIDLTSASKEDDLAAEALFIDCMAETILKGWSGVTFKGTAEFPYSVTNARTLLAVKDFRKKISGFSESFDAFKVKTEAALGNG